MLRIAICLNIEPNVIRRKLTKVNKLRKDHADVLNRLQALEKDTLIFLEGKKHLGKEEYLATVSLSKALFKNDLVIHFKVEEMALFPILITKSPETRAAVLNLLKDHNEVMKRFRVFEETKQSYEDSIVTLTDLLYTLSQHAMKEDELFATITLTEDEEERFSEVARVIETWPLLTPY